MDTVEDTQADYSIVSPQLTVQAMRDSGLQGHRSRHSRANRQFGRSKGAAHRDDRRSRPQPILTCPTRGHHQRDCCRRRRHRHEPHNPAPGAAFR